METIYAIPGLGVDHRLFSKLYLEHGELKIIRWISPRRHETLAAYALRLAEQIDHTKPFSLLGVSFGGMCAVEIAKRFPPRHLFLVSTSKCRSELPLNIRTLKYLPVHRLFSDRAMARLAVIFKKRFGVLPGEQEKLFYDMLCANPPGYFRDTISAIANWENTVPPEQFLHLHGTADRLIPCARIRRTKPAENTIFVENGTHFMIMNQPRVIVEIIDETLDKSN